MPVRSQSQHRAIASSIAVDAPGDQILGKGAKAHADQPVHRNSDPTTGSLHFTGNLAIHMDCNMSVSEVALGLALQTLTPFRFSCNRILMQRLPELYLPPYNLIRLFDPLSITQFELEDPAVGCSLAVVLPSVLGWLISLRNLRACSLPACLPPPPSFAHSSPSASGPNPVEAVETVQTVEAVELVETVETVEAVAPVEAMETTTRPAKSPGTGTGVSSTGPGNWPTIQALSTACTTAEAACKLLNRALLSLRHLQRLGILIQAELKFSTSSRPQQDPQRDSNHDSSGQPLRPIATSALGSQDCSLSPEDVNFLVFRWRPLTGLYELNLSRNNLSRVSLPTLAGLVKQTCLAPGGHLACLSLAYTCLPYETILLLMGVMAGLPVGHEVGKLGPRNRPRSGHRLPTRPAVSKAVCYSFYFLALAVVSHGITDWEMWFGQLYGKSLAKTSFLRGTEQP
ncbi:unnamed protein product [Protopolystoma xenopodis]|uniref:Uncharacterized protein n=1 Tax=Protopolystoma xenopodis TaxID=117903 RepID=A0A3S5B4L5_9PLAT|nr:unnamed protein product [Protopolystoma xenopodis]